MKKLVILLSFAFAFINSIDAQTCFQSALTYSTGSQPIGLVTADFNGDGKADLATARTGGVTVLLGAGTGAFSSPVTYSAAATPENLVVADFNGDGNQDFAVTNFNSNNVSILLGTGTGAFGTAVNYTVGNGPSAITAADYNSDGFKDLAVTNFSSDNVTVLKGLGTGSFVTASVYYIGFGPGGIASGDFNGDNKIDLATTSLSTNSITILLGLGTCSFSPPSFKNVGAVQGSIIGADFNGDSKLDLAIGHNYANNVSIVIGSGFGTFGAPVTYSAGTYPSDVASPDLNGDGNADLVVVNYSSNNISVRLNNGNGTFGTSTNYGVGAGPGYVVGADFNGDGKTDLAVTNNNSTNVSILRNARPTISVTSGSVCAGKSFTIVPSGATTYTVTGGTLVVSPAVTTTYTITGASAQGCLSAKAISSVDVRPSPVLAATPSSTLVCIGNSVTLTATGALSYTWNTNENTTEIVVSPTVQTIYTITGTNAEGCMNSAVSSVTIKALPSLTVASSPQLICSGESATLSVAGALNYTWSTAQNITDIIVSPTVHTTYSITGKDADGCANTATVLLNVDACTGIPNTDQEARADIKIFPNPNNGFFTIVLMSACEVTIVNAFGQLVVHEKISAGPVHLDIRNQPAGVYFLISNTRGKQDIIKLLKE